MIIQCDVLPCSESDDAIGTGSVLTFRANCKRRIRQTDIGTNKGSIFRSFERRITDRQIHARISRQYLCCVLVFIRLARRQPDISTIKRGFILDRDVTTHDTNSIHAIRTFGRCSQLCIVQRNTIVGGCEETWLPGILTIGIQCVIIQIIICCCNLDGGIIVFQARRRNIDRTTICERTIVRCDICILDIDGIIFRTIDFNSIWFVLFPDGFSCQEFYCTLLTSSSNLIDTIDGNLRTAHADICTGFNAAARHLDRVRRIRKSSTVIIYAFKRIDINIVILVVCFRSRLQIGVHQFNRTAPERDILVRRQIGILDGQAICNGRILLILCVQDILNATFDVIQNQMVAAQSSNRHIRCWLTLLELIRRCCQSQFGVIDRRPAADYMHIICCRRHTVEVKMIASVDSKLNVFRVFIT